MRRELIQDDGVWGRRARRMPPFAYLMKYQGQFAGRPAEERRLFNRLLGFRESPDFVHLELVYMQVAAILDRAKIGAKIKTHWERDVQRIIRRCTNLQYKESLWIGPYNADLFFPMIAGIKSHQRRHQGLAVEINGVIHDSVLKMAKDNHKANMLHRLGIGVMNVDNIDIFKRQVVETFSRLNSMPRLDSRARTRVMTKVYCETVLCEGTDSQLVDLFGIDFRKIQNVYETERRGALYER